MSLTTCVYLLDLLPAGYRPVEHRLIFEPHPVFETQALVAFPTRGFGVPHQVQPGEPFEFSGKYGTRIYLLAKGEAFPDQPEEAWKASHASAPPPVAEVSSVPLTSPIESILTRVRVQAAEASGLTLAIAAEEREHLYPPWLGWLVPVVLVALGIWGLVKLRAARLARTRGT